MSVLTNVERKSKIGIVFQTLVFIALLIGGATMVYPFLLMLAGATRSPMDSAEIDIVPDYLMQDDVLSRKFLERKFNVDLGAMLGHRPFPDVSFDTATIPERVIPERIEDLRRFVEETDIPDHWWILGGTEIYQRTTAPNKHRLTERLQKRYDDDLAALNADVGVVIEDWYVVQMTIPGWTSPRFSYEPTPFYDEYFSLLRDRPLAERAFSSVTNLFLANAIYPEYGKASVDQYNRAHARPIESYYRYSVPRRIPGEDQPQLREEWLAFVGEMLNPSFIRTDAADEAYRSFLRDRYATIDQLNRAWAGPGVEPVAGFDAIDLPGDRAWIFAGERADFADFLQTVDPQSLYLVGPEFAWRDWIRDKYGSLDAFNAAHEADLDRWTEARIPIEHVEHQHVLDHAGTLRWQLATSNFRDVFNEVLLQGRPFLNSVIYVLLSLIVTLTIQPLAAYALSRFDPPGTWRIILIFMATMAFPPMVGLIPQFLILRKLDLLNTFLALILPVIVNGHMIFLLKGFFDSLPQFLYEAALIDGASEMRMFREIAMALSKPILAVVALGTFNHAWLAFLYPLLVASDESMHVLAVWLYQFQQNAPTSAVFASILVTSIPTLVIFIFTQRTIMRGIAVPAEK